MSPTKSPELVHSSKRGNACRTGEILKKNRLEFKTLAEAGLTLMLHRRLTLELGIQIKEALLQRDLAQAQRDLEKQKTDSFKADFDRAREDAARFHSLFMSERELRIEASQFVPHGNKTRMDRILSFLDSPAFQFSIKAVVPIWTAARCAK